MNHLEFTHAKLPDWQKTFFLYKILLFQAFLFFSYLLSDFLCTILSLHSFLFFIVCALLVPCCLLAYILHYSPKDGSFKSHNVLPATVRLDETTLHFFQSNDEKHIPYDQFTKLTTTSTKKGRITSIQCDTPTHSLSLTGFKPDEMQRLNDALTQSVSEECKIETLPVTLISFPTLIVCNALAAVFHLFIIIYFYLYMNYLQHHIIPENVIFIKPTHILCAALIILLSIYYVNNPSSRQALKHAPRPVHKETHLGTFMYFLVVIIIALIIYLRQ